MGRSGWFVTACDPLVMDTILSLQQICLLVVFKRPKSTFLLSKPVDVRTASQLLGVVKDGWLRFDHYCSCLGYRIVRLKGSTLGRLTYPLFPLGAACFTQFFLLGQVPTLTHREMLRFARVRNSNALQT